mgnify:CR=1 FL=1
MAQRYLIDPNVLPLTQIQAISLSVASFTGVAHGQLAQSGTRSFMEAM